MCICSFSFCHQIHTHCIVIEWHCIEHSMDLRCVLFFSITRQLKQSHGAHKSNKNAWNHFRCVHNTFRPLLWTGGYTVHTASTVRHRCCFCCCYSCRRRRCVVVSAFHSRFGNTSITQRNKASLSFTLFQPEIAMKTNWTAQIKPKPNENQQHSLHRGVKILTEFSNQIFIHIQFAAT